MQQGAKILQQGYGYLRGQRSEKGLNCGIRGRQLGASQTGCSEGLGAHMAISLLVRRRWPLEIPATFFYLIKHFSRQLIYGASVPILTLLPDRVSVNEFLLHFSKQNFPPPILDRRIFIIF